MVFSIVKYPASRILLCWKSVWGMMREDLKENGEFGMLGNLRDYKKVILDVACCYLWLFPLYVNIKIDKNTC